MEGEQCILVGSVTVRVYPSLEEGVGRFNAILKQTEG